MKYIIRFFNKNGYEAIIETNIKPERIIELLDIYKLSCKRELKERKIGDFLYILSERGIDFINFKSEGKEEYSVYF